jgi:elongation factor G
VIVAELTDIRNISIGGHGSSGKTTLAEGIIYLAGAKKQLGSIDKGNTVTDYNPDEVKRKISIQTAVASFDYKKTTINLIDIPGYLDFIGEMITAVYASDFLIVVIDSEEGIETGTDIIIRYAQKLNIPFGIFINKMDKDQAKFTEIITNLNSAYDYRFLPLSIPSGAGEKYKGVCDILRKSFSTSGNGKPKKEDIPNELKDDIDEHYTEILETACESDEDLMEKFFAEEDITPEEILGGIKDLVINGEIIPVFCGSALKLSGVDILLENIPEIFPSPEERKTIKATDLDTQEEIDIKVDENESLVALVFKTIIDPYAGRLSLTRVFSGEITPDTKLYSTATKESGKIGSLLHIFGKEQNNINKISTGDIGVIAKYEPASTGDILTVGKNISLPSLDFPEPVMHYAIFPKTKKDEDKLSQATSKLLSEDPTLNLDRNAETKETVLSGMGDLHLQIVMERMKDRYNVDVESRIPKVSYRETVKTQAEGHNRYKKQSGGRGQYGEVYLRIEPLSRGEGYEFEDAVVGGVIPSRFIPSVEKGIQEVLVNGVISDNPVIDLKVTVYDGSHHSVDSSDIAFKIAGSLAFKDAFMKGNPTLLEPIMEAEIIVPDKYLGDITGDISSKRGRVLGMESAGNLQKIKVQVPQAEMGKFCIELRSMTQGTGTFTMKFDHYEEVPHDLKDKIIASSKEEE